LFAGLRGVLELSETASQPLVLLAEDESLILTDVQSAFEQAGFEVLAATSGLAALALLNDQASSIRALVTDIDLGKGPNGWSVAHVARELNPSMAVVFATSTTQDKWAAQGVPSSIFIAKPYAPTQVVVAVAGLLNSSMPPTS
jgi:DNA-binding response OmpR family regulator